MLQLAGCLVHQVKTDSETEAKQLMSVLKPSDMDAILIAGGDGTVMEMVTGLLRREDFLVGLQEYEFELTA